MGEVMHVTCRALPRVRSHYLTYPSSINIHIIIIISIPIIIIIISIPIIMITISTTRHT